MKMKRYFAPDSRQALRALRDEQGPEAVILSNKRVNGGVEIIAAMDYEDSMVSPSRTNKVPEKTTGDSQSQRRTARHKTASQYNNVDIALMNNEISNHPALNNKRNHTHDNHNDSNALTKIKDELAGLRNIMEAPLMQFSWGETDRVQPLYANLLKQLLTMGLSSKLSKTVAKNLLAKGLNKNSWDEALNHIAGLVPIINEDILENGGIISLIGPTGVGKTTTIAKIAAQYALKHGRRGITLITTDNYRIGAHEQLRSYGRILGIPVHVASDSKELNVLLKNTREQSGSNHLTLIDTAGISQKDIRLTEQITSLVIGGVDIKNYLVLSATGQMNLQDDVIRAFSKVNLESCIVTKIDEAASLGEIISVLIQNKLPISFVCDGQKVPDDLHRARGKLLINEAIKLMKNKNNTPSCEELAYAFGGVENNAII